MNSKRLIAHGVDTDRSGLKEQHYVTIDALNRCGQVLHAFTTRQNGQGARNNGVKSADDWDFVARAFKIEADRVVTVNQVHGENVVTVDHRNFSRIRTLQADAMITSAPGIAIGVETADCVPVLLIDPVAPAVGAVHAGWRSTVKSIVQKAANKMRDEFGSDPSRMIAAIGPAIGPECYEVDEPVMALARENFPFWKDAATSRGNGRWSLDLAKLNRIELARAGLPEGNIHSLGLCTSCRRDLFYSFRAEGRTGRMLSVIMIIP